MAAKIVVSIAALLGLAACDMTYTPGLHHAEDVSTGSHLSGTDTGANASGTADPSLSTNAHGPSGN